MDDEPDPFNVPNLKQKDSLKQEPADNSPLKRASSGSASVNTPASKLAKGKRKMNADDSKPTNNATPPKKVKTENVMFNFAFALYLQNLFFCLYFILRFRM